MMWGKKYKPMTRSFGKEESETPENIKKYSALAAGVDLIYDVDGTPYHITHGPMTPWDPENRSEDSFLLIARLRLSVNTSHDGNYAMCWWSKDDINVDCSSKITPVHDSVMAMRRAIAVVSAKIGNHFGKIE